MHRTAHRFFRLISRLGSQCSLLSLLGRQILRFLRIFRFCENLILLAAVSGRLFTALLHLFLRIFFRFFCVVGRLVSTGCQAQGQSQGQHQGKTALFPIHL